ncbi:MAG: hypothetical protein ACOC9Y_00500, partial [Chloroflexota bacterium]
MPSADAVHRLGGETEPDLVLGVAVRIEDIAAHEEDPRAGGALQEFTGSTSHAAFRRGFITIIPLWP